METFFELTENIPIIRTKYQGKPVNSARTVLCRNMGIIPISTRESVDSTEYISRIFEI